MRFGDVCLGLEGFGGVKGDVFVLSVPTWGGTLFRVR